MLYVDCFRLVKTEFREEYQMKRFGGIELNPSIMSDQFTLINENLITQLNNIISQTGSTSGTASIDVTKVLALFRIHPTQASVSDQ